MSVDNVNDGPATDELLAAIEQSDESATETNETEADGDGDEGEDGAGSETETDAETDPLDGLDDGEDGDEEGEDEAGERRRKSGSARLREQNRELKRQLAARTAAVANDPAAIAAAVAKEVGEPPKEADFAGDFAAFDRALTAYEVDKRATERRIRTDAVRAQEAAKADAQERFSDLASAHQKRLDKLEKALPGARAAIQNMARVEINDTVGELLLESPKSDLLALYFAKNPGKLSSLNGMSERAAVREVTRLESKLALKQPRTETRAAPPLSRLSGATRPQVDPSKMTMAQYRKFRARSSS